MPCACSTMGAEDAASRSCQLRDQVGPEALLVVLPAAHQGTHLGSSLTSADRVELGEASQGPTFF